MVQIGGTKLRRYEFTSVKERALAELVRRIKDKDWTFQTVAWDSVSRLPLPRDVKSIKSATIRITDGVERFNEKANTQTTENAVDVAIEYAIPVGADEEPSTVLNIVAAEILDLFAGEHELFEGGTGQQLAITLYPREYVPDLESMDSARAASAMITFELRYRTHKHRHFLLPVQQLEARPPAEPVPDQPAVNLDQKEW